MATEGNVNIQKPNIILILANNNGQIKFIEQCHQQYQTNLGKN